MKTIWKPSVKRDFVHLFKEKKRKKKKKKKFLLKKFKKKIKKKPKTFLDYHAEYLKTDHWKFLREVVLRRCEGFCENCWKKPRLFHVHHLTYERWKHEELEDLIALCETCHSEIHGKDLFL